MTIATLATAEQRREQLLSYAEAVVNSDGPDPTLSLTLLVPPLCAAHIAADPDLAVGLFEGLVGAVAEHRRFTASPGEYVIRSGPGIQTLARIVDEFLLATIDEALDRLLGAHR